MNVSARGWLAFALGGGAVLWSCGLVLAAFVMPAYSGEGCQSGVDGSTVCGSLPAQTLFAVNGWWVVELLLGVALVTALAFWALHVYCVTGKPMVMRAAGICIGALGLFAFVSGFSIGLFVFPAVLLLIVSAVLTPSPEARPAP